jgi:hypothetical protein
VYKDKKTKERLELGEQLSIALGMLGLSQGLIQFADSKANGLVLVNSIFILAMTPALEKVREGSNGLLASALGAFFVVAALALLASLWVTLSRGGSGDEPRPKSIVFFKHVAALAKGSSYVEEVREAEGERVLESVLLSNYDLSQIAKKKFSACKLAERCTVLATLLWVLAMSAQVLAK